MEEAKLVKPTWFVI